ncbi:DsbA family protein [Deinococcus radiopugnans]|uniref:DsbA family protein n=1 Tax=Deinococcus radiopugnans ATCC 19172 TaxID=585398 RepID=A0A5C4Y797_9DEIO|nr:DsbA family protein [Deinococcus radiopugnans]MBB6014860.1 protein-disulfide isomerase [Deinococcus radiopugnans ATCC 19172]TNM71719.1 DsbA family protein [Deinococcus radiopugnans ATCC 19172]
MPFNATNRLKRAPLLAALGLIGLGLGRAGAQVGQPLAPFLNSPSLADVKQGAAGLLTFADGSSAVLQSRGGYVTGAKITVSNVDPQKAAARAAELTGLLSGFGSGLAEPLLGFLGREDVGKKLLEGLTVDAEPFAITVKADAQLLSVDLKLARVPDGAFAPTANALPARRVSKNDVVLRVYSDFQCPYCRQFESETLPALLRSLPDDVRVEFHQFPLESIHPLARPAAEASECAAKQGKFWAYKDALFRDQSWLAGQADEVFAALAAETGLNTGTFNTCLATRGGQAAVDAGLAEAERLGLNGTPSVFVGPYQAANPFDTAGLLDLIKFTRAVEGGQP